MPSLFPLNICLTAWHCLRAGCLFTAPARLGGTKGTVSCGSSPGSPWKRRVSSPLCSRVVVASGRGQMWLCSVDSWAQIRPQSLPHRTREESIILQTRSYEQESKKKINSENSCISLYKHSGNSLSWNSLIQIMCYHYSISLLYLLLQNSYCTKGMLRLLFFF